MKKSEWVMLVIAIIFCFGLLYGPISDQIHNRAYIQAEEQKHQDWIQKIVEAPRTTHVVQSGETVANYWYKSSFSDYPLPVYKEAFERINNLRNASYIREGQELELPVRR